MRRARSYIEEHGALFGAIVGALGTIGLAVATLVLVFVTKDDDGGEAELVGHIRHSLKRIEAQLGRYYWTECRFEVHTPDTPRQQARYDEVEDEVKILLTRLKALDRGRRLIPA